MKQAVVTIKYEEEKLNAMCHNGIRVMWQLQGEARQGLKGAKERSVIPQKLCEHIVDICEE